MDKLERIIKINPSWDKRNTDPQKDYGIHNAELHMTVKGKHGSIVLQISTGWYLKHLKHVPSMPMGNDLGIHSNTRLKKHDMFNEECQFTGKKCYYSGSGLAGQDLFQLLIEKGDEAVWSYMESLYAGVFRKFRNK